MARSRHTEPPHLYVKGRFPTDAEGRPIFPRVVRRRPRPGDVHPIERKPMGRLMLMVPPEYLYGLKRVELRPRVGQIGQPYGYYSPSENFIVLYSVPRVWDLGPASEEASFAGLMLTLKNHGAEVKREGDRIQGHWLELWDLQQFFYWQIFLHELGHHYSHQWKRRRKRPPWGRYQELIAELHKQKLSKAVVRKVLRLMSRGESSSSPES